MNGKRCWSEWSAVFVVLALAACGGGGGGGNDGGGEPGDVTAPAIVSTFPANSATGVSQTTAVTATFSEDVAPASVTSSTFSLSAGALPVGGTLTVSGSVATFTPMVPLVLGTLCTARLGAGVTDLAGNALTAAFLWNFTTETVSWPGTWQLGTAADDTGNAVAVDSSGNIYVAGSTSGDLDGAGGDPFFGSDDYFLAKFDPAGSLLFTRQLGTVAIDGANAVAVDGSGNVYVVGNTSADLDGAGGDPFFGGVDVFVAKFDSAGNQLFTRQFGTVAADGANAVAVDGTGNVYVVGSTSGDLDGTGGDPYLGATDFFLAKLDPAGSPMFTRQFGTVATDEANAVAVDGFGNVYVVGNTSADLDGTGGDPLFGGVDFFVAKFDSAGKPLFTRQLGTIATDEANAVAVDGSGNVYVAGNTSGDLDGTGGDPLFGGVDFFVATFDSAGKSLFTQQLGTAANDEANAVAVDGAGNLYVVGTTSGDLDGTGGDPSFGASDFFLARLAPSGGLLFTRQLGTVATDSSLGVAVSALSVGSNVFVTGETSGGLDGNLSAGTFDLFLTKFDPFGTLQ